MSKNSPIRNPLIRIRNKILAVFGDIKINKHFPWIPYYKPQGYQIRGKDVRRLLNICKPGDVLLRGFTDYFDGLFIGKWSHVGLVLSDTEVIHAMAEGVIVEDIINFFRTDRVYVLRPDLEKEKLTKVLGKAQFLRGTPYDFGFNFNNPDEVSCSEFVYICFSDFDHELGMSKGREKVLFFTKVVVRPAAFLDYTGFKKVENFPQKG
jgi:hypothetical protein